MKNMTLTQRDKLMQDRLGIADSDMALHSATLDALIASQNHTLESIGLTDLLDSMDFTPIFIASQKAK